MNNANAAVGDAERLMAQMLMLARVDAASKEAAGDATCNLSEIARGVCEDFVLQLSTSNQGDIDLGFHSDGDLLIRGEQTLVQEVIRNLIDNAVKHGGKNLKIDVSVERERGFGAVSVQDNGVGMRRGEQSQTRELLKVSAGKSTHNSGIGLTIVQEILNLLSGRIEFGNGAEGRGTKARVFLQLAEV